MEKNPYIEMAEAEVVKAAKYWNSVLEDGTMPDGEYSIEDSVEMLNEAVDLLLRIEKAVYGG